MKKEDILASAATVEESSLSTLHYWLQYEKHTWILGAGIGWLPYHLILIGMSILAVIFTPFMLWHLFKAKWYKSIATFCSIVVLPFVIYQVIQIDNSIFAFLLKVLPLVTFYFYMWVLSYLIGERLIELNTIKRWKKEELMESRSLK